MSRLEKYLLIGILVALPLRFLADRPDDFKAPRADAPAGVKTARPVVAPEPPRRGKLAARRLRLEAVNLLSVQSILQRQRKRCGGAYEGHLKAWQGRNGTTLAAAQRIVDRGGGLHKRERDLMAAHELSVRQGRVGRAANFCGMLTKLISGRSWDFDRSVAYQGAAKRVRQGAPQ